MWNQTCRNFVLSTITLAVFSGCALAANHHELNGTWRLVPARSELHGEAVIETGSVTINDRQGNIYVSRNFNFDTPNQSTSTNFSTDARAKTSIKEPGFKSKAKWDGDVLKVVTTQEGVTTTERYSLREDGAMMLQLERTGHQPETLYFER
ncbi:MAG: hypothetical protein JOZ32_21155 [Bryobacterales bacterium]|nr:hypothetical protein [Bryobacterales bacterium]